MRTTLRILAPAALVMALVGGGQSASGQGATPIEGVWSTTLTAPDHPAWRTEDLLWGAGPRVGYEHLRSLLADPSNDDRTLEDLRTDARLVARLHVRQLLMGPSEPAERDPQTDPAIQCQPPGLIRLILAPAPIAIDIDGDHVVIHHEVWNTLRTIPSADERRGPAPAGPASRLGSSTARLDGATLVVESSNVSADQLPQWTTSDGVGVVERYTPTDDGARLSQEVTVDDPKRLREPLVISRMRVRTPGEPIIEAPPCELISGEFEQ